MQAAAFSFPEAAIAIPSPTQCFMILAPIAALAALSGIYKGLDQALSKCFPGVEWQRQLGWFNIKAERQAAAVLRWIGYTIMAMLAVALYGIVWGAEGLRLLSRWYDP